MSKWIVYMDIGNNDTVKVNAPNASSAMSEAFSCLIDDDQRGEIIHARGAKETSPHFLLFAGGKYYLVQAKDEKQAWAIARTHAETNPQFKRPVSAKRVKEISWKQGNLFS